MEKKVDIKKAVICFNCPASLVLGHREYRGLDKREFLVVDEPAPVTDVSTSSDELMKLVFAVDPVTKLPSGDVAMYMSENTSPEIKAYIQKQFMSPQSLSSDTTFDGLSDDELVALSRGSDESVGAYASRMRSLLYSNIKRRKAQSESNSV